MADLTRQAAVPPETVQALVDGRAPHMSTAGAKLGDHTQVVLRRRTSLSDETALERFRELTREVASIIWARPVAPDLAPGS